MLFISMGIFDDDFHPEILSVGTTANSPLIEVVTKARYKCRCIYATSVKWWVWFPIMERCALDKVCQWLATDQWFSPGFLPWIKLTAKPMCELKYIRNFITASFIAYKGRHIRPITHNPIKIVDIKFQQYFTSNQLYSVNFVKFPWFS